MDQREYIEWEADTEIYRTIIKIALSIIAIVLTFVVGYYWR